jgi:hypothetical protein
MPVRRGASGVLLVLAGLLAAGCGAGTPPIRARDADALPAGASLDHARPGTVALWGQAEIKNLGKAPFTVASVVPWRTHGRPVIHDVRLRLSRPDQEGLILANLRRDRADLPFDPSRLPRPARAPLRPGEQAALIVTFTNRDPRHVATIVGLRVRVTAAGGRHSAIALHSGAMLCPHACPPDAAHALLVELRRIGDG